MNAIAWWNARLLSHPYTTKASGTFVTYVASDLTAQAIESESMRPGERAARALTFGAVGGLWVGPLLTKWFYVMDRAVPGTSLRPVAIKLVVDQLIQGPLMIGSMFVLCALSNGANGEQIVNKLRAELYHTWVSSVYVWAPVQVAQQAFVPIQYRVTVANFVSYFWDTYLSLMMMPAPAEAGKSQAALTPGGLRRRDSAPPVTSGLVRRRTMAGPVDN